MIDLFEQIFGKGLDGYQRRRDFEAGFKLCQREASQMLREQGHSLAAEKVERLKLERKAGKQ